jgi:hypothetical protein
MMSLLTISSSVYPKLSLDAAFIAALISSAVTFLPRMVVSSVREPVSVGTR